MGEMQTALDRYGSDLVRWPAAERAQAEAILATNPHAATLLATQRRLDRAIATLMEPMPVDAALIGRIAAHVGERAHHDVAVKATPRLFAWVSAAMVMFLVGGFAAGVTLPASASQSDDSYASLMFGGLADSATATDSGSVL
jgi:anti-sigma factor RsiW